MQNTITAIFDHYKQQNEKQTGGRPHLGASIIGKDCDRAIWFDFHWVTEGNFSGRILRLFETGHMAEPRFVKNLRSVGVSVDEVDPNTGKQFSITDHGGHFQGSLDGLAIGLHENPDEWHVVEFKTHGHKSFAKLVSEGVIESKPQHYAQMQIYMHYFKVQNAYYMAVCKDSDDLYGEIVPYNEQYAEVMIKKAKRIIDAAQPPEKISQNPSWFVCKFCDHWDVCHGNKIPKRHCRTCAFSTPKDDGSWHCEKYDNTLTIEAQREGCIGHLFNPYIINANILDSGEDWIAYEFADGTAWQDG